jgi:RNA polymerase sigma-70 factor (ECF subfamily)
LNSEDFALQKPTEVKPTDEPDPATAQWATIEQVFEALESPLLAYARRLAGNPCVAEDVVQEAFMRLHMQFTEVRQPQPWLYRTVHNLVVNHQRETNRVGTFGDEAKDRENTTAAATGDETADSQPIPDEQIARWEGIGLVRLVLETLDDRSKEIVRMRFDDDLSYLEIGERMGLKVGHVGYLLHHALRAMAVELTKMEVAP